AVGRVGTIYDYFDYRRVGGVLYPFRTVERQPHGTTVQTTLRIRRNTVIPDGAFRFGASGCGSGAAAGADAALGLPPGASAEDSLRVRTVELVWRIIAESHYDTTFGGVDWNAVRLRYRALAGTAADREEFHRILHRMVGELRQTHFRVGTSDGPASGGGEAGMDLTWNLSKLVVTRVRPGSAAERAGIGPGDIIQRIGGRTPDDLLSAYDRGFGQAARREPHRRVRAAGAALAGRAGDTLVMEIDRAGRTDSARLVLQARQGLRSLDDLSEFEVRRLAGNVAYIRFSSFFGSADARFRAAIDTLGHSRGLIIDLRGNPGGAKSMIAAIAGTLFVRGGTLGSTRFRYQTRDFAFQGAGRRAFRRPVMVLVDERTGSSAEVLAGALQSLGRARVVGDTTAGAVLPSVETPLPTGAVLQYVISDYRTPDGQVLEGRGVIPDIFVRPTPAELRAGHDPALDRAHSELLAEARSGCTGPASAAGALHLQRVHPAPAQAREEPAAVGGRRR
ncbi:MAG TPA: S41 family peptidase, partial [Longimicrobium sp.]